MSKIEDIISCALDAGFSFAIPLDVTTINLYPEVREMCADGKCKIYNKNWTCPPACGTLEECRERLSKFDSGIIVQTMGELKSSFDYRGMLEIGEKHKENFLEFQKIISKKYSDYLALGAGGCTMCEKCTYPDSPCRHPELALSSMESYGMMVSEVCKKNDIPYNYGPGTIAYVGCCLFNGEDLE